MNKKPCLDFQTGSGKHGFFIGMPRGWWLATALIATLAQTHCGNLSHGLGNR